MIKVTVSTNSIRKVIDNIDPSTRTIRSVLDEAGLDYNRNQVHFYGDVVTRDMMDKTFVENGIYEDAMFSAVVKADSAC